VQAFQKSSQVLEIVKARQVFFTKGLQALGGRIIHAG